MANPLPGSLGRIRTIILAMLELSRPDAIRWLGGPHDRMLAPLAVLGYERLYSGEISPIHAVHSFSIAQEEQIFSIW